MTDEEKESPPGALRRALFQDVPYILDSLWRWGEFRLNRLGTVQFEEPHAYVPRPAWKCGAFMLYALMCVFAIFGPTWDARIGAADRKFAALAAAYLDAVDWEPRESLERRAAALLPGLLLARVDGKSPVEYIDDDADRERVRRVARALLLRPVARLSDVANAWRAAGTSP